MLLAEEEDIVRMLGASASLDGNAARYRQATKVAMQWIKNYTEFDFRSLGSYTRADLAAIAEAPDAF